VENSIFYSYYFNRAYGVLISYHGTSDNSGFNISNCSFQNLTINGSGNAISVSGIFQGIGLLSLLLLIFYYY
jgi:hypothetical protein